LPPLFVSFHCSHWTNQSFECPLGRPPPPPKSLMGSYAVSLFPHSVSPFFNCGPPLENSPYLVFPQQRLNSFLPVALPNMLSFLSAAALSGVPFRNAFPLAHYSPPFFCLALTASAVFFLPPFPSLAFCGQFPRGSSVSDLHRAFSHRRQAGSLFLYLFFRRSFSRKTPPQYPPPSISIIFCLALASFWGCHRRLEGVFRCVFPSPRPPAAPILLYNWSANFFFLFPVFRISLVHPVKTSQWVSVTPTLGLPPEMHPISFLLGAQLIPPIHKYFRLFVFRSFPPRPCVSYLHFLPRFLNIVPAQLKIFPRCWLLRTTFSLVSCPRLLVHFPPESFFADRYLLFTAFL